MEGQAIDKYIGDGWETDTRRYSCQRNGFGHYWPMLEVKAQAGGWCRVIIRDSNPFKTLSGAIKYVEKHIEWTKQKEVQRGSL